MPLRRVGSCFLAAMLCATPALAFSDRDALLAAVRDRPLDDTPRLVFADWCDDHGDPDRANFIRAQVELASLSVGLSFDAGQSSANDAASVAPCVYLPGDTAYRESAVLPYLPVDTDEAFRLEKLSRQLFDRHWRRWIEEIDPVVRSALNPRAEHENVYYYRRLRYLPGTRPSDFHKRWWYARFRRGFFGSVGAYDWRRFDAQIVSRIFDPERSTIVEVSLPEEDAYRHLYHAYLNSRPEALARLSALKLLVMVGSASHHPVDGLSHSFLADPRYLEALRSLGTLSFRTSDWNPDPRDPPAPAPAFSRASLPELARTFFSRVVPMRLTLGKRSSLGRRASEAYWQALYEVLRAPELRPARRQWEALTLENVAGPGGSPEAIAAFVGSMEKLRAFRLDAYPVEDPIRRAIFQALGELAGMEVLFGYTLGGPVPLPPHSYPRLRRFVSPSMGGELRAPEEFQRILERNGCAVALARGGRRASRRTILTSP